MDALVKKTSRKIGGFGHYSNDPTIEAKKKSYFRSTLTWITAHRPGLMGRFHWKN